jgi:2-keto-3-deoxy-L-rhamnonate aldolase RhmA
MNPDFCTRLRARDLLVGTIVSVDSVAVMEVVASSGLDWIFIEAEHAPIGMAALERLIMAAGTTPCLVRLPNHETTWIKRALDLGAAGIIVPQVNTVGEAKAIANAARFTPQGERGLGVCRANAYGDAVGEYLGSANTGTAVLVQAEHVDAVDNASAIASVDGIDGVFVGPYDLSASMGLPGQLDHAEVNDAIEYVRQAFAATGKPAGYFSIEPDEVKKRIGQGFSLVACTVDVMLLRAGATALAASLRGSGPARE